MAGCPRPTAEPVGARISAQRALTCRDRRTSAANRSLVARQPRTAHERSAVGVLQYHAERLEDVIDDAWLAAGLVELAVPTATAARVAALPACESVRADSGDHRNA